jgi:hypothetical protein
MPPRQGYEETIYFSFSVKRSGWGGGGEPACQGYRRAFLGGFQGVENLAYGCVILHLGSWLSTFRWSTLFPILEETDTRLPD